MVKPSTPAPRVLAAGQSAVSSQQSAVTGGVQLPQAAGQQAVSSQQLAVTGGVQLPQAAGQQPVSSQQTGNRQ